MPLNRVIKPVEFTPRYKGLGLGAERRPEVNDNKRDRIKKPGEKNEESERTIDG